MQRELTSGILLITSAAAGVVVMALHPQAHALLSGSGGPGVARPHVIVHSAAMASMPVLFLGLLGLARRLGSGDLTAAALVVQALAAIAGTNAAVTSGLVATPLFGRLQAGAGSEGEVNRALLDLTSHVLHGFADVYLVASFVAVLLWSAAILRSGRMPRAAGIAGLVLGAAVLLGFLGGHLRLDVHHVLVVTLAQSAWLAWVGAHLCRGAASPAD